jgi:hypothetical protein
MGPYESETVLCNILINFMYRNKAYVGKNALLLYASRNGTQAAEKSTAYSQEEESWTVYISERSYIPVSNL